MEDINGIVLMGGRSSRMGTDKAMLKYKGKFLYQIASEKLTKFCPKVYLSVNSTQEKLFFKKEDLILDMAENEGPISGLISCLTYLKTPILVLSCDMPMIELKDISLLISNRDKCQICTTFYNENSKFYEPMLSIWEINALSDLEKYFKNGGRSIQFFLNQHEITKNPILCLENFININKPEDIIKIQSRL